MHSEYPSLITALLAPGRYPGDITCVELVQTHISWILMAGEFVYKIKKPVSLQFLDFSTLALRRQCCEDELRLNRRFAPDLYLDVLAITGTPEDPHWGGQGDAIEYAVKMRRFDDNQRLDRVCQRAELTQAIVGELARSVVDFHAVAAVAEGDSCRGTPERALAAAIDNLQVLAITFSDPDVLGRVTTLRAWTAVMGAQLAPQMQLRHTQGLVRECHGDLHLGNLVLIEGRVRLFDCIEFSADLRWIDVVSDLAFAYMDLLQHQQPGLANWLVNEVFGSNGDYSSAPLLRFFAVYRALVRAAVAAIRSSQVEGTLQPASSEVLAYITLAEKLANPATPRLVITHGLSGCGKTMASNQLLLTDTTGNTLRLRSDVERKRLFGLAALQPSGSGFNSGIYAPDAHQRTYAHLLKTTQALLEAGWSVVVDAAFLRRSERDAFAAVAQVCKAYFAILAPSVPLTQLRARIVSRQANGGDASEATLAVLENQLKWIEPLSPDEQVLSLTCGDAPESKGLLPAQTRPNPLLTTKPAL